MEYKVNLAETPPLLWDAKPQNAERGNTSRSRLQNERRHAETNAKNAVGENNAAASKRASKNNGRRAPIPQAPPTPSRDDRARQRPRKGDVGRRMPRHRREAARARRAGRGDEARQNVSGGEALRRVQKADGPDGRLGRPGAPVLFGRVRVFRRPTFLRRCRLDGVEVDVSF